MTATTSHDFLARAEQRIARWTLLLGSAASAVVALTVTMPAAAGVAAGAGLAWLNFRWLEAGVTALTRVTVAQSASIGGQQPRIPWSVYAKLVGRYALLGAAAYGIVTLFRVPVWSIFAGLFSLGAAAMAEGLYEVFARPD